MTVRAADVSANVENGFGYVELVLSELADGDDAAVGVPARMSPDAAKALAMGLFEAAVRASIMEDDSGCVTPDG